MFRTLQDDLLHGDFAGSFKRDFREAREYMIDEERRQRLSRMKGVGRWFYTIWWMLRSMFFKLTPARRILLVLGLVCVYVSRVPIVHFRNVSIQSDTTGLGVLCILFVLILELKDKLLAKEELEAGRAVQEAMMPERSPSFPGWQLWLFTRSANEVGGDLVDFLRVHDEKCGVVLGDVAGKGLRAALLMVKLQATVRALVPDEQALGEMGVKLNQVFCREGLRNMFASMVYVELLTGSGNVRVLNAGHFPPVVVRRGKMEILPKGGAALGITPDATFAGQEVALNEADLLCVYSDGLTEAQNEAGDFLGEQRFLDILSQRAGRPVGEIGEGLVAEVDRFIGEARRRDDLSIVLIRKVGAPA